MARSSCWRCCFWASRSSTPTSAVARTSSTTSCRCWPVAHNRVAILGTGLIGASIGLALKAARPQTQIAGYDASGDNLRRAQGVKAIDRRGSLRDVLTDADLVIVSTPVGSMKALFEEMAPLLPVHALVMDTGSTKAQVLRWAADLLPDGVRFIGGHPMAGKTETGPGAARRDRRGGQAGRIAGRVVIFSGPRRARRPGGVGEPPALFDVDCTDWTPGAREE